MKVRGRVYAGDHEQMNISRTRLQQKFHHLYEFCERHGVPYTRRGKLVLATTPDEIPQLEDLHREASANGAVGVEVVDASFVTAREPHVRAMPALWSPSTGVLEAEALVRALRDLRVAWDVAILVGTAALGHEDSSDS